MTYEQIISQVADSVGLDKKMVDKIYRGYWKAIRLYITSLPLKEDLTDEEFLQLRPNVSIPSIGKLYITLNRYKRAKERNRKYQEYKNGTTH